MGGLKPKIVEYIRMFKPKSVKDATNLARMRDDQLQKRRRGWQVSGKRAMTNFTNSVPINNGIKKLP